MTDLAFGRNNATRTSSIKERRQQQQRRRRCNSITMSTSSLSASNSRAQITMMNSFNRNTKRQLAPHRSQTRQQCFPLFGMILIGLSCMLVRTSYHEVEAFQRPFLDATISRHFNHGWLIGPRQSSLLLKATSGATDVTTTKNDEGVIPADSPLIDRAASNVLDVAQELFQQSSTGVFLSNDVKATKRLKKAVDQLEAVSSSQSCTPSDLVGDWKLVVTTSKTNAFGALKNKKKTIKSKNSSTLLQKAVQVVQRIRLVNPTDETEAVAFNRVDNVFEITPPKVVEQIQNQFDKSPIKDFLPKALNPLEITKQKVTLVHKARIEDTRDVLRTKISLQSIILTLAGKSQYLEPDGADVLGLNVPLGDLLNQGSFDTTYVDDKIRISRGTVEFLDELRVFVKLPPSNTLTNVTSSDELMDVLTTPEEKQASKDVDEALELEKEDRVENALKDKESFEEMAKETSTQIARELRDLSPPEITDAFDDQFNKTFGKTPLEVIGDQSFEAAGRVYDAGEQLLENIEDAVDFLETNVTSQIPTTSQARRNATAIALEARTNVPNELANVVDDIVNATVGETPLQLAQNAAELSVELAENVTEATEEALEDTEGSLERIGENATKAVVDFNETLAEEEE